MYTQLFRTRVSNNYETVVLKTTETNILATGCCTPNQRCLSKMEYMYIQIDRVTLKTQRTCTLHAMGL